MSSQDLTIVLIVFGAVIAFSIGVIVYAARIRGTIRQRHLAGPGHAGVPAPADPWRRFTGALAAPYARYEWAITRGAARSIDADQTYFGYGAVAPPSRVMLQLRKDWGVTDTASATEQVGAGIDAVERYTRGLLVSDLAIDPAGERDRLAAAGVSAAVIDEIRPEIAAEVRATEGAGDADLESLRAEIAFDIGRVTNLLRWSAWVGYVDEGYAHAAGDVLAACAVVAFSEWNDYGRAYLAGLEQSPFPAHKGRRRAVDWLVDDAESPWRRVAWPGAPRE
ncbi:DUF1266 domain-containing protein [Microbacterium karelineae]|uniref:DUF1266 domain-containing protein n=1 Tax=Microbacterium karelineae TaxID=2654283 RepID=UPI0018D34041|nr:DUF1266 domain-containing protein [Microbacterium karelineae]